MEIDYRILILIFVLAVFLIVFFIRRNREDQADLEDTLNKIDEPPETHTGHPDKED